MQEVLPNILLSLRNKIKRSKIILNQVKNVKIGRTEDKKIPNQFKRRKR